MLYCTVLYCTVLSVAAEILHIDNENNNYNTVGDKNNFSKIGHFLTSNLVDKVNISLDYMI